MLLKAILIWLVLMVAAVFNGWVRERFIRPRLGEYAGHVISTIILSVLILLVSITSINWIGAANTNQALLVGAFWLVLTLAFEFLAGHYLFGNPWEKLLADYNILRGRVWVVVLVMTLLSPFLAMKIL